MIIKGSSFTAAGGFGIFGCEQKIYLFYTVCYSGDGLWVLHRNSGSPSNRMKAHRADGHPGTQYGIERGVEQHISANTWILNDHFNQTKCITPPPSAVVYSNPVSGPAGSSSQCLLWGNGGL